MQSLWDYYFPLYDLTSKDFFTCYPVMSYFSALVYEADETIEASQKGNSKNTSVECCLPIKNVAEDLFKHIGILTLEIERELNLATEYVLLEDKMVCEGKITHADLRRAMELRSFDLRVLHRAFLLMLGRTIEKKIFDAVHAFEVLAEIEDDLAQYHEDVEENKFNTYRALVNLYRTEAPLKLKEDLGYYRNMFEQRLSQLPANSQDRIARVYEVFRRDFPSPEIPEPILE
ncbi:MAG: hypothetical protein ACREV1_00935 [Gammaproteobacteria bacterium]